MSLFPKKLRIYTIAIQSPRAILESIQKSPFQPLQDKEACSVGFVPPYTGSDDLTLFAGTPENPSEFIRFAFRKDWKDAPNKIVKDETAKKVAKYVEKAGHSPSAEEIDAMGVEAFDEIILRAFPKSKIINGWIDIKRGWLVFQESAEGGCSDVIRALLAHRVSTKDFDIKIVRTEQKPSAIMHSWILSGNVPDGIDLTNSANFKFERGGRFCISAKDVLASEVQSLSMGGECTSLSVSIAPDTEFTIGSDLSVSGIDAPSRLAALLEQVRELDYQLVNKAVMRANLALAGEIFEKVIGLFGGLVKRGNDLPADEAPQRENESVASKEVELANA